MEQAARDDASASDSHGAEYHFGVLLVHGIGEQHRNETLLAFGDPLVSAIGRWLSAPRGSEREEQHGRVEVVAADLDVSGNDRRAPPHASLRITAGGGDAGRQRWLLAENAWGTVVRRPRFGKLAGWLLTTGGWAVISHMLRSGYQAHSRASRLATRLVSVPAGVAAMLLLQIAVGALAVLAVLPIPPLRTALSGLLLKLTGVLGDSYVLLESELQAAAIVSTTRRDLRWLAERCRTVAVLAHSQGAAVAHRALRDPVPSNVALLVTFGSGLAKLEELQTLGRTRRALLRTVQMSLPLALTAVLVALRIATAYWEAPLTQGVFFLALMLVMFAVATVRAARADSEAFRARIAELSLTKQRPRLDWFDLYATHDPVPQGPLDGASGHIDGVESRAVTNLRSPAQDHTSYWANDTEFVPQVLRRLGEHAGLEIVPTSATDRLGVAATQRARRVVWRQRIQVATLLGAVLLVLALRDHVGAFGGTVLSKLSVWLPDAIGTAVARAAGIAAQLLEAASMLVWRTLAITPDHLLGVTIILGAVWLWNRLFDLIWQNWAAQPLRAVFQPNAYPSHPVDRALMMSLVIGLGFAPVALAASLLVWPDWPAAPRADLLVFQIVGAILVLLVVLVVGVIVVRVVGDLVLRLVRRQAPSPTEWAALVGLVFVVPGALLLIPGLPEWVRKAALAPMIGAVAIGIAGKAHVHLARFAESRGVTCRLPALSLQVLPPLCALGLGVFMFARVPLQEATDVFGWIAPGYVLGLITAYPLAWIAGKLRACG